MATALGLHAERLVRVRALRTAKGRREQGRFAFEGATLLSEACASGTAIQELYVTQAAYDQVPLVRELDRAGTVTYVVDARSERKISDLETPTGVVAIAPIPAPAPDALFAGDGIVLALADVNDPGNAGTLLRAADAFAARGVVFGAGGVDPYHPKVVRAAMGSLFRVRLAVVEPTDLEHLAAGGGFRVVGLTADGQPLGTHRWSGRDVLLVGHERHGLGRWERFCADRVAIVMPGAAESLNAAVAGSIALYEAAKRPICEASERSCQDSIPGAKSQDYRR